MQQKDFEFAGLHFRFDNGSLDVMREARASDAQNPLEGLTGDKNIASLMIYGGLARVDIRNDKPVQRSWDDCKKLYDDLTPGETNKIIKAWSSVFSVSDDQDAKSEEGEKKST